MRSFFWFAISYYISAASSFSFGGDDRKFWWGKHRHKSISTHLHHRRVYLVCSEAFYNLINSCLNEIQDSPVNCQRTHRPKLHPTSFHTGLVWDQDNIGIHLLYPSSWYTEGTKCSNWPQTSYCKYSKVFHILRYCFEVIVSKCCT